MDKHCLIIGGGIAGLTAALYLHRAGINFTLLEKSDVLGGRVATDSGEGFLFDRGFQVFLTAYPEAKNVLDYSALDFRPFYPGADIFLGEKTVRVADPVRHPLDSLGALFAHIGTLKDKVQMPLLRSAVKRNTLENIFALPEISTKEELLARGFSEKMIQSVFVPFLGGIFLEQELSTSRRMYEFVFKMFYEGDTVVPARGMGAIPAHIASKLPPAALRTASPVRHISDEKAVLESGEEIRASHIIIATDMNAAAALCSAAEAPRSWHANTTLYFSLPTTLSDTPLLWLNGTGRGLINSVAPMSLVSPHYAPAGEHLLSVSVIGENVQADDIESAVETELRTILGEKSTGLRFLRRYDIPHSLPSQKAGELEPPVRPLRLSDNIVRAGDYLATSSINGAMQTGRIAAQAVIEA